MLPRFFMMIFVGGEMKVVGRAQLRECNGINPLVYVLKGR